MAAARNPLRPLLIFVLASSAAASSTQAPPAASSECAADLCDSTADIEVGLLQVNYDLQKGIEPSPGSKPSSVPVAALQLGHRVLDHTSSKALLTLFIVGIICLGFVVAAAIASRRQSASGQLEASVLKVPETEVDAGPKVAGTGAPDEAAGNADSDQPSVQKVLLLVVGHCLCASTLTVVNKWALNEFRPPVAPGTPLGQEASYVWTLVFIQFAFAALVTWFIGLLRLVRVEGLEFKKSLAFFPAAGMFMITIAAGNAVMNYSSVNTFLVIRSLVPLPVAFIETILYADPWPPAVSFFALFVTVGGAIGYCFTLEGLALSSISWAVMYLVLMPVDGILIKHSVNNSGLSPVGLVYYNNFLAALPCLAFVLFFEITDWTSFSTMMQVIASPGARWAVPVSCLLGVAISFFQLNVRSYISATAFMVLGVMNKFLTVLVNKVCMENQGGASMIFVLVSLAGAVLWQQTVKGDAIKQRSKSDGWEKKPAVPFIAACGALAWALWIEHKNVMSQHG